ncbi:MAG: hypothetical protein EOO20_18440 [Chryseobacterium sp.]|nr:MAG: hypothetical protein EOO20_18440 [Chryseobacterium sp.]
MKKLLSISLLLLFLIQATSSLWILVSFYVNRNYISKNICINRFDLIPICEGQCYLTDRLKKNDAEEQKLPELKQKEVQLFYLEDLSPVTERYTRNMIVKPNFCYLSNYTDTFIVTIFQPPRYV